MQVIKRNGSLEEFNLDKILEAILKADYSREITTEGRKELSTLILKNIKEGTHVEDIQNIVESILMQLFPKVAKAYILYRDQKNKTREYYERLKEEVKEDNFLLGLLYKIRKRYATSFEAWYNRYKSYYKQDSNKANLLIKSAVECTTTNSPEWDNIAGFLYYNVVHYRLPKSSFYDFIVDCTKLNLYNSKILEYYKEEDIVELEEYLNSVNVEWEFTYSSVDILYKRYLNKDKNNVVLESIPRMFMGIAMYLAIPERAAKVAYAKMFYDQLVRLNVTMATPTLSNARKPKAQLSSCFIDTVEDSLSGIYKSLTEFANVSKWGGGMGIYIGKVRAVSSPIRGFKGAAGGVIPWVRLFNDTAVAVNQLGQRAGSCAITLDIWHKDVPEFLQIRTNNGDDRMKAHDIFPAISIPDYFWHLVDTNIDAVWYLFCPYEIKEVMGFNLEDYWGEEWEQRYKECINNKNLPRRTLTVKDIIRLIIKSAVETGTPFLFNRDTVNKYNPIKDKGIIYSSNLCSEIAQNMLNFSRIDERFTDKNTHIEEYKVGEYVTCNLASLVLSKFKGWREDENIKNKLASTIKTVVRVLDNVIEMNELPTPFAYSTNKKYRAIGIGTSGYHHLLALEGIPWESEEHIKYADELYEFINYTAIKASNSLAKTKGSCEVFEGSTWHTGEYFDLRGYTSKEWQELREEVHKQGIRNAYIMAIAPTGSTSVIAGTTAGIDPIQDKYYLDEKKGSIVPRVAPDLNNKTYWLYKEAHNIDHSYTIKAASVRQRHIDQSQSLNLFITHNYSFKDILNMYLNAWKLGVKTIYYIRSKALEVEECVSCSS